MTLMEQNNLNQYRYVFVQQKNKIRLIPIESIYYFQSQNKQVILRTAFELLKIPNKLSKLEEYHARDFIRIHRDALISPHYIDTLEKLDSKRWQIGFRDIEDKLEVSRRCLSAIRQSLVAISL